MKPTSVFSPFLRNDSKFPCHIGCAYLAPYVHVSVLKKIPLWREKGFFLPKANYTMKNLLNSLRPFFKFAKFSFGAESQWSILKNFIRKMSCSLTHLKKWDSFLNQSQSKIALVFFSFIYEYFFTEALMMFSHFGWVYRYLKSFYPLQFPKGSNKFQIMV